MRWCLLRGIQGGCLYSVIYHLLCHCVQKMLFAATWGSGRGEWQMLYFLQAGTLPT